MFTGASTLNLDAKGRIAIPARHRAALGERCGSRLVVTVSPMEKCLWLYPGDRWQEVAAQLSELSPFVPEHKILKRLMLGFASEQEMDRQGRIMLPPELREYAGLDKKATLLGQGERFEIWKGESMPQTLEDWVEEANRIDYTSMPGVTDLAL